MKKVYLIPISMLSISIPIYFDIFFEIELWSILIIPAFLTIVYFPSWRVGVTSITILTIIQLSIELIAPEIRKYDLITSRHRRNYFGIG
jgi:hypothetical protein